MSSSSTDAFGPTARVHHVGIAVHSIEAVGPDLDVVHDPIQRVRVAFTDLHGLTVEFIEPADTNSPVSRSLRAGQRLQHVCYEVDDLGAALMAGRSAGFIPMGEPVPAVAFDGRRIAWVFHSLYGLVELLERTRSTAS